jgi:hypothetical protein
MEEMINVYILVGKHEEKISFEMIKRTLENNSKVGFKEIGYGLGYCLVARSCEHGDEHPDSIRS